MLVEISSLFVLLYLSQHVNNKQNWMIYFSFGCAALLYKGFASKLVLLLIDLLNKCLSRKFLWSSDNSFPHQGHFTVLALSVRPFGMGADWVGTISRGSFLLQRVFLTQGLNPGLPALQADALPSEPLEKLDCVGRGCIMLTSMCDYT